METHQLGSRVRDAFGRLLIVKPRFQIEGSSHQGNLRMVAGPVRLRPRMLGDEVPLIADWGTPAVLAAMLRESAPIPPNAANLDREYVRVGLSILAMKKGGTLPQRRQEDLIDSYTRTFREWRNFIRESAARGVPIIDSDIHYWSGRPEGWRSMISARGIRI